MFGPIALSTAVLGLASLLLDNVGKFIGLGLGLLAVVLGVGAYRGAGRASARLLGAGAITLGAAAILLSGAQITLTLVAIDRMRGLLEP